MNKSQAELINYAIMPGHVMETVSIIYESCLRKMPGLPFGSAGFICYEATGEESSVVTIASRYSQLTKDFNKGLKTNASVTIRELLN
ncbi:MAG TPA: hypothetical protein VHO03_06930 [Ignavibacteriales bacterium]|nr:hypothetical protein [Ignavibacteriales bacterium]